MLGYLRECLPDELAAHFVGSWRYRVIHGGRGGGKSWAVARALLTICRYKPFRVLCAREFQRSIKDSVHRLLVDQREELGLRRHYRVGAETIRGCNGSEFLFAGLRHNVSGLRSLEGIDICWVEEAQCVSRSSWDILIPTIRKSRSEIWATFNPEMEEDEAYQRFVINPPANARVMRRNWSDNPYLPDVLRAEQEDLKARDPAAWAHVWNGECRRAVEGAVFAAELARAREEGRLTAVPHEPGFPVHTFWDLGWADSVCIWMAQSVGGEFRVIDFLQGAGKTVGWFNAELNKRPWQWGEDWLPHDATAKLLAAEGRTIMDQVRAGCRKPRLVPRVSVADGINAARTVFDRCWFDQERCADGLHALRHYRYAVEEGRPAGQPLHDWASHAADAFRYLAVSLREQQPRKRSGSVGAGGPESWMI